MCIVSSPSPPPAPKKEDPEYLRNPFLDVASNDKRNASSIRIGRNALRVDGDQAPSVGFSGRTTSGSGQSALTRSPSRSSLTPGHNMYGQGGTGVDAPGGWTGRGGRGGGGGQPTRGRKPPSGLTIS